MTDHQILMDLKKQLGLYSKLEDLSGYTILHQRIEEIERAARNKTVDRRINTPRN